MSLDIAKDKLGRLLELYAPMGVGRENTMLALSAGLYEFEAAVREDERALQTTLALVTEQVEQRQATSAPPLVVPEQPAALAVPLVTPEQHAVLAEKIEASGEADKVADYYAEDVSNAPVDVQPDSPTLADMGKRKRK